jgi:serine phosphatase RsbU (regulator of sigma subunit)
MDRLERELLALEGSSAAGAVEHLVEVLREKAGGMFEDDTTLMAIRVEGKGAGR